MPKFPPGTSGNPAGRRPGAVGMAGKLRLAMAKEVPDILEALVARAKQGDVQAASLILARVMPPLRPTDEPVSLDMGDLNAVPQAVMAGLASGALTPGQAQDIANTLASLVRVRESTELENRIEALENQRNGNP